MYNDRAQILGILPHLPLVSPLDEVVSKARMESCIAGSHGAPALASRKLPPSHVSLASWRMPFFGALWIIDDDSTASSDIAGLERPSDWTGASQALSIMAGGVSIGLLELAVPGTFSRHSLSRSGARALLDREGEGSLRARQSRLAGV